MFRHPDADAFMRKYLSQPTDAITRLVFADWLEETCLPHNAAWAYYIRLKAEADAHEFGTRARAALDRQAEEYAPKIRANLTNSASLFVGYPRSLLQLLPPANITVRLANFQPPRPVLEFLPEAIARENFALPLDAQGQALLLAAADPHDDHTRQRLEFILNRDIVMVGADAVELQQAIDRGYDWGPVEFVDESLVEFVDTAITFDNGQAPAEPIDPGMPVVRLVNLLLRDAVNRGADRVLIYPDPGSVAVRFRIDDEWIDGDPLPARLLGPISSRLAHMAGMPTIRAIARSPWLDPMTGLVPLRISGVRLHIRVTIQPSPDGPTTQIDLIRES